MTSQLRGIMGYRNGPNSDFDFILPDQFLKILLNETIGMKMFAGKQINSLNCVLIFLHV